MNIFDEQVIRYMNNVDIFSDIMDEINDIKNEKLKNKSRKFIICFNRILNEYLKDINISLPPLRTSEIDEYSILYEWYFQSCRFGFRIENDDSESYWHLIAKINDMDINISGDFCNENMNQVLYTVVSFVLGDIKYGISKPIYSWNYQRTISGERRTGFGSIQRI